MEHGFGWCARRPRCAAIAALTAKPCRVSARAYHLQQVGLAAEQMGAAGDVEKQPMRRIERHQRGKTVAPVGDVVQNGGIGGGIGIEHGYLGTDRPRIGQRLANLEPEPRRGIVHRIDLQCVVLFGDDDGGIVATPVVAARL